MRSHAFNENQLLGRGERSRWCCSELNSFLFLFGFQMANLHRCTGQTAGLCQDWEQTQHMLLHRISNVGTRKRGCFLGLGIEDAGEMEPFYFAWLDLSVMSRKDWFFWLFSTPLWRVTLFNTATCQSDPSLPAKPEIHMGESKFFLPEPC